MPRGYRRRYRYYRSAKSKYSNETNVIAYGLTDTVSAGTTFPYGNDQEGNARKGMLIVPATNVYGTRKAKNFDISLTTVNNSAPILAVLVYVPQGTLASNIAISGSDIGAASSLYEPNQNVICQFVIPAATSTSSQTLTKYKTRLARNLDSGDSIVLILAGLGDLDNTFSIAGTVNYCIKY